MARDLLRVGGEHMVKLEPFTIEITDQGMVIDGRICDVRSVCELLEWWFSQLDMTKVPIGTRFILTVEKPNEL